MGEKRERMRNEESRKSNDESNDEAGENRGCMDKWNEVLREKLSLQISWFSAQSEFVTNNWIKLFNFSKFIHSGYFVFPSL